MKAISIYIWKFSIQWREHTGTLYRAGLFCLKFWCQTSAVQWLVNSYLLAASSLSMSLFNLANAASLLSLQTLDKGIEYFDLKLQPSLVEILQGHCRAHSGLQCSHLVFAVRICICNATVYLYLQPPQPYPSLSPVSSRWGWDPDQRTHCILSVNKRVLNDCILVFFVLCRFVICICEWFIWNDKTRIGL